MAYDDTAKTMVLFGGEASSGALADTWIWNGSTWVQQKPTTSPSARQAAGLSSFPPGGGLVLFGGQTSANASVTDTWTWHGSDWTQLSPAASPSTQPVGMTYDAGRNLVVFFGRDGSTWTWGG